MQGVPSVIRLKRSKPSEDIRNLFDRKTYLKDRLDDSANRDSHVHSSRNQNKEPYYESDQENFKLQKPKINNAQAMHENKDVQSAIDLRNQKQKHTDFFFKLAELKDRIDIYNEVFMSRKPKFINLERAAKRLKEQQELKRQSQLEQNSHTVALRESRDGTPLDKKGLYNQRKTAARKSVLSQSPGFSKQLTKESRSKTFNFQEATSTNAIDQPSEIKEVDEDEDGLRVEKASLQVDVNIQRRKSSVQLPPQIANTDQFEASLPQIERNTGLRIKNQNRQSYEKAIETQKKQEQQTTQRLNAIEKKMPPLLQNQSQKQQAFNMIHTTKAEAPGRESGFQKFLQQNQMPNSKIMMKNRSQGQLNNNQNEIKPRNNDQLSPPKEPKTLLQSHSYADFKTMIDKKQNKLKTQADKGILENKSSPQKDKSLIIKSIYESNVLKDSFHTFQGSSTKRPVIAKHLDNPQSQKKQAKSPSPIETVEENQDLSTLQPVNDQGDISLKDKKQLPPVSTKNKFSKLNISQSQTSFVMTSMNEQKIKQISQLYNSINNQSLLQNNQSTRIQLQKLKQQKSKKRGGKSQSAATLQLAEEKAAADMQQKEKEKQDDIQLPQISDQKQQQ